MLLARLRDEYIARRSWSFVATTTLEDGDVEKLLGYSGVSI